MRPHRFRHEIYFHMRNTNFKQKLNRLLLLLLFTLPVIAGLLLLKGISYESITVGKGTEQSTSVPQEMASPIRTLSSESQEATQQDSMWFLESDTLITDHRLPMEAGDEDGYWDGWTDGAEAHLKKTADTQQARLHFDPSCHYKTAADRTLYQQAYTEAYEVGFNEAYY